MHCMNTFLKYTLYFFHILFIFSTLILWIWFWQIIILQFIVILSWIFNKKKCLITQLENKLFNQTLLEFIYNKTISKPKKYIVPSDARLLTYFIFVVSIFYHLYLQIKLQFEILQETLNGFT